LSFTAVLFAINDPGGVVLRALLERGVDVRLLFSRRRSSETADLPYVIAHREGIPCEFPDEFTDDVCRRVRDLTPDLVISGWYHLKIPLAIIEASKSASVNLHPSLLPAYRGATPVEWCIMNGEGETGLTLHKLEKTFDTGDILWQQPIGIDPDETAGELLTRITGLVPQALDNLLLRAKSGDFTGRPQESSLASYHPKRSLSHAWIDWAWEAQKVHNRIRGLNPWPLARFKEQNTVYQVGRSRLTDKWEASSKPGTIKSTAEDSRSMEVVCGDGRIIELFDIAPAPRGSE